MNFNLKKLVSIIIPAYNCEAYLGQAIESVLAQKYRPIEIIVIDDGSTDATAEVARRFGYGVHCESQAHQGIGAARNRGLMIARGGWLAFLDADDLWTGDKLMWQLNAFNREPELEAVFGYIQQFISPELGETQAKKFHCPPYPMPGYVASAMLIRREAFMRIGFFGIQWKISEWLDWYQRATEQRLKMLLLPDVVARRRLHLSNQGVRHRDSQIELVRALKAGMDRRRKN